VLDRDVMTTGH